MADCTILEQNWWPNKGREYFTSAWWGWDGTLSLPSLDRGRVAQPLSSENKTFHHLGEKWLTKKLNSIS
jgi:hypothetical protein